MIRTTPRIERDIVEFLHERGAGGKDLSPGTDLLVTGILDSLLIMDLLAHLEHAYCVRLETDDVSPTNFRTPSALADLVDSRRRCA
jgi:acyl carrier protein